MSHSYTPTAAALTSITVPDDGDLRSAASVNGPLQALANGVSFISMRSAPLASLAALTAIAAPTVGLVRLVTGYGLYTFESSPPGGPSPFRLTADDATSGGWVSATAHQATITRQAPVAYRVRGITNGGFGSTPGTVAPTSASQTFVPVANADGQISAAGFGPFRAFTGASQNYGYLVDINVDLVDGATLTSATLYLRPAGHAALPARQPAFGIIRTLVSTSTETNLLSTGGGLVTLAAASQAAYDAAQSLVFAPDQNNVVDKSAYHYSAVIFDEAGANSGAGGLGFLGTSYRAIGLAMTIPDARRS